MADDSAAARRSPAVATPAPRDLRRIAQDDERRSFLRTVSHELRTPLNAIIGFSEIIARQLHGPIEDARYVEHAEIVRDSGLRLLALVNQIVDIARLEAGAMDLDIVAEPLREVVEEALTGVAAAAAAKAVELRVEMGPGVDRALFDRRALATVLGALLDNAITFSPERAEVRVRGRRIDGQVLIEVCDHGEGIEPAHIARLMRPFEQGESALVRRFEGAGLGLPMARLLVHAMGGRLRLHSVPGEGTTAVVRLPIAEA